MPVYKDPLAKKNPWYYHLDTKDERGKRKLIKKRGFKTKTEAQKVLVEAQALYNKGEYVKESKMLYQEFIKQYLESKKISVSKRTLETYTWLIEKHILPYIGSVEISKLQPQTLNSLYNKLISEVRLASENVQKVHTLIKNSLDMAVEWGLINKNAALHASRPKAQQKKVEVWDIHESQLFLKAAREDRCYIAFMLGITTGMRQGEILGLKWENVDFDRGMIYVCQTLSHDGKEFLDTTKTKAGQRSVAVDESTLIELRKAYNRYLKEKETDEFVTDNGLVVSTSVGTPVLPTNLVRTFKRLIKQAEVKDLRFHDLRHTHCTMLLKMDEHPKKVAERVGHKDSRMMDRYSHILPNMQKETANKFGNMFYQAK